LKKKLSIILIWTLVSLLLQFGAYSVLNIKVQKVMAPPSVESGPPITLQYKTSIPGSDLENVQISYDKGYLAYMENNTLKVFNLRKKHIVFEKKLPSANDKTLGVLAYQWLPDRDTLLYFYAKKNPNPITYVTVYPPTPELGSEGSPSTSNLVLPKTEDPNQTVEFKRESPKEVPQETPVGPRIEKRYGNPQITELYSLELSNSDEDTAPEDRFNQTIYQFPAGGKIEELVVSTTTNLIYLTVKNELTELLMEIDVMKNVRILNRPGETINNMAASDRYGTLFIDSKVGGSRQVIALSGIQRKIISKQINDRILGIQAGKVYLGEIENNQLVKIKTTEDRLDLTANPSLKTEWTGSIPFNNVHTLIGIKGQIVICDQHKAYVVTAGRLSEFKLYGEENYVSGDGTELIQLNSAGTSTLVKLQPLNRS